MSQLLKVYIAAMQLVELTKKIKHLTSNHSWFKSNNLNNDVKLCTILQYMILHHEVVGNGGKKPMNKLKPIKLARLWKKVRKQ